jgi:hypothetical protein
VPLRYEAILRPRAEAFLNSCDDAAAREVLRLVEHIRIEPYPNETSRITLIVPPAVFTVLVQTGFWIVYHVVSSGQIAIVNIGRDSQGPPRHY